MEHTQPSLSIIIPAYNEEANIEAVVRDSVAALSALTDTYDIVVIDDASTDTTWAILERLRQEIPQLATMRNPRNVGCHPSTIQAWPAAKGDYRLFIPADRQIPPSEMGKFLQAALAGADVVYSWRVKRADPLHRCLISACYNLLLRLFFNIRLHDVDSSSLLSARAVAAIMPRMASDSAFISVEILVEASRQGFVIAEVPIDHLPRVAGVARGINLKDLCKVPLGFAKMLVWILGRKLAGRHRSEGPG